MATKVETDGQPFGKRDILPAFIDQINPLIEDCLDGWQREVFHRIHEFEVEQVPPFSFYPGTEDFIAQRFQTTSKALGHQETITVRNIPFNEASIYNKLRASRPIQNNHGASFENEVAEYPPNSCDQCHVYTNTPIDGVLSRRLEGRYSITAADATPFYAISCQVLPSSEFHDPSKLTCEVFHDMVMLAKEWIEEAKWKNPKIRHKSPVIGLNHGPDAGQSVIHPHLRVGFANTLLEPEIGKLWQGLIQHRKKYGFPLFNDMVYALAPFGLVFPESAIENSAIDPKIIFDLTPRKERGCWVVSRNFDQNFTTAMFSIISWYREIGEKDFNLEIYLRPEGIFDLEGIPNMARFTGRRNKMGVMEVRNTPVISEDRFALGRNFQQYLLANGHDF